MHKKFVVRDLIDLNSKKSSVQNESNQLGFEKSSTKFDSKLVQIELKLSLTRFETLLSSKLYFNFEPVRFETGSNRIESNSNSFFFNLKPYFNFESV